MCVKLSTSGNYICPQLVVVAAGTALLVRRNHVTNIQEFKIGEYGSIYIKAKEGVLVLILAKNL
jgi:hypothetical protein